jgi:hypothetical protein
VSEARIHDQRVEVLHDQIPAASGAFAAGAARFHAQYVEVLRSVAIIAPPPTASGGIVIVIIDS